MRANRSFFVAAVALAHFTAADADAQGTVVPATTEFTVNNRTLGRQTDPSIAATGTGNFLVSWSDSDLERVYMRSVACGSSVGSPDVLVEATESDASVEGSRLAQSPSGTLSVWTENRYIDHFGLRDYSVVAQGFAANGQPVGNQYRPLDYELGNEFNPDVAPTPTGDFVLAWEDYNVEPGEINTASRIRWQRIKIDGSPVGDIVDVAPYSATGLPINPAIAATSTGNIFVVWQELGKDGSDGMDGILLQRFTSQGETSGPEIIVNTTTSKAQDRPEIIAGPEGQVLVVWQSDREEIHSNGIYGQFLDAGGDRLGREFWIDLQSRGDPTFPDLALIPGFGILVTWESQEFDGDRYGAFARAYSWSGMPLSDTFQLNTLYAGDQRAPIAAADATGNILVAWTSPQDGDKKGITARFLTTNGPICGDAAASDYCRRIDASDALTILRAAVSDTPCSPCVCDVDGSGSIGATDALMVLRAGVGLNENLNCAVCEN